MTALFATLNAFIEDTCVLVAIAYLLARGRVLTLLFRQRPRWADALFLGLVFGLIGITEAIFPGARYPYVTHTLMVTFAALNGGPAVGAVAAVVTSIGALTLRRPDATAAILGIAASLATGVAVRRSALAPYRSLAGVCAGMMAQAGALAVRIALARLVRADVGLAYALVSIPPNGHLAIVPLAGMLVSIPANGVGVMLLQLVIDDARVRADSERHRLEAEQARTVAAEAELTALRARVHPHFLFNTLTSIAALCSVASDKAEEAIIALGQLMRRALEADARRPVALAEEIQHGREYVRIEQHRLGSRLRVQWDLDEAAAQASCPPFAVQTLIENAVIHGIAPKVEEGAVTVRTRRYRRRALVAVMDDGVGMAPKQRASALGAASGRPRGLQIVNHQLVSTFGAASRLRLFSQPDCGTMVVFAVPPDTLPASESRIQEPA